MNKVTVERLRGRLEHAVAWALTVFAPTAAIETKVTIMQPVEEEPEQVNFVVYAYPAGKDLRAGIVLYHPWRAGDAEIHEIGYFLAGAAWGQLASR